MRPIYQSLYPTLDSLEDVLALVDNRFPPACQNEVIKLLMTYHNTILKVIENAG